MNGKQVLEEPIWRAGKLLDAPESRYPGFHPGTETIPAGHIEKDGALAVAAPLTRDQDAAIVLRDGTTLYADIYRPTDHPGPLPAILVWSPYGKREGFMTFEEFPFRAGVPQSLLSALEKFEGPDPARWCRLGYAIVQPDARGAYRSEGKLQVWDQQEGRDGADVIEWIAAQPWSNGRVGMAGTSWLGIAQWFVGAERPPHLAALAPWEGMDDEYRTSFFDGGINEATFVDWLLRNAPSEEGIEDVFAMIDAAPEFGPVWAAKRAAVERIEVPTYVAGSWSSVLHARGLFEGWHRLQTDARWLRVYDRSEWPDFYRDSSQDDLTRFFDRYLKGEANGWEETPRVRLSIIDAGRLTIADRAEDAFPPVRVIERTLYLDHAATLSEAAGKADSVAHEVPAGATVFRVTMDRDVELTGYARLHLFIEADGADDADVFVKLTKEDADGHPLGHPLIPIEGAELEAIREPLTEFMEGVGRGGFMYDGPWGRMRASRRGIATDPRDAPRYPPEFLLEKGEIVELVITFAPMGMIVHAGETLCLTVAGHNLTPFPMPGRKDATLRNAGRHILHTGGDDPSRLVLPVA